MQHLKLRKLKFGIQKIGCSMSSTRYLGRNTEMFLFSFWFKQRRHKSILRLSDLKMSGRLSEFVCQVPHISGRFPSPLAGFPESARLPLMETVRKNCRSWLSKRYLIRILRIHIFFWLHCATTSCLWLSRWKQIKEYCFAPIHMKITNSAMEKELFHENQYSSKEEIIFANYAKKESKVSFIFQFVFVYQFI